MISVVFHCILVTFSFGQPPNPPSPSVYWFPQKFDHFNSSDTRTWKQRYLVYDNFYQSGGPIFFCPGGEANANAGYNHNGLMFELAQKLGAFLLFPEHRFYGESLPFGSVDSFKPGNIQKLTVEQSMADYIAIIKYAKLKWNIPPTTPLISFGGSYPGDLTVYLRIAYPDIIDAGLASSAPLRYHIGQTENGAFFQVVTDVFGLEDSACPDLVRSAFSVILKEVKTPEGCAEVTKKLRLCTPIEDGEPVRLLALWVENAFATLAMANYPYPLDGMPKFPLLESCSVMKSISDPIEALGQTVGVFYNATGTNLPCFNISAEYYPCADITGCGGGVGDPDAMSWDFQSCTELVSNVDTNNETDMFPSAPYDYAQLLQYCSETWNSKPDPHYIPNKFNYLKASRLILSNGKFDPWYPGGVLEEGCDAKREIYCFLIDEAAHHLDLRGSDFVNDPVPVIEVRLTERSIITQWVKVIAEEKRRALL